AVYTGGHSVRQCLVESHRGMAMAQLEFVLLGSAQAQIGQNPITVESRKALALLFYLAVTRQPHTRDRLATLFWPEQGQARARTSLRQVLWLLRNAGLGDWIASQQDALALQTGYGCDVHAFEAAIEGGALAQGLALYGG